MRLFILIGSLIEIIAGIIFFFSPTMLEGVFAENVQAITYSKMYGVAAISIGSIGIAAWQHQDKLLTQQFLRMFIISHFGICLSCYSGYSSGIAQLMGGVALHLLMGILSVWFYLKVSKT